MATQTQTLQEAREQLTAADQELATLDAQIEETTRSLGEALAAMRLGDRKAERKAGDLSLSRAELERQQHDLSLVRASLASTVQRLEAEERETQLAATLSTFERLTDHARELESTLARQMEAAGESAAQLRRVRLEWHNARNAAAQAGHDVEDVEEPRDPGRLFVKNTIENAKSEIATWLKPVIRTVSLRSYPVKRSVGTRAEPKPFLVIQEDRVLGGLRQLIHKDQDGAA
jgi:chromosome segregation ATPase